MKSFCTVQHLNCHSEVLAVLITAKQGQYLLKEVRSFPPVETTHTAVPIASAYQGRRMRSSLEGKCKFPGFRLLALVAPEVGQQLAHQATDLTAGNVEGCQPSNQVACADRRHPLLCILHLLRPDHLHNQSRSKISQQASSTGHHHR